MLFRSIIFFTIVILTSSIFAQEATTVTIGMTYARTGPYAQQGLDQWRGAQIVLDKINREGGILGHPVEIVYRDVRNRPDVAAKAAMELIEKYHAKMIMGASSSGIASEIVKVCAAHKTLYLPDHSSSSHITCEAASPWMFRSCFNAWMGAKALGAWIKKNYPEGRVVYITADYSWGWSVESSIRRFSDTQDEGRHKTVLIPHPASGDAEIRSALELAERVRADVLVLTLFGNELETALELANEMGLKQRMQFIAPELELNQCAGSGPERMQNVVGVVDWVWEAPYQYDYKKGIEFVEEYARRYQHYPCWAASLAYINLTQYKEAVERAGTFDGPAVIAALEGRSFVALKDEQTWRAFDHQGVQSVFLVKCKPAEEVRKDRYQLDFFQIIDRFDGDQVVRTKQEWQAQRLAAGLPPEIGKP
ncbi:ABC transporter substrate-binding protein [Candidatus Sumerlaeota bacterium]|nr:ABC transporter substrate-binding protein [Candidatus Sumerlaeota bacterium]